ncbi:MAG TPA: ABC transporter substrate-binding protein, partial [Oceanicaulis sp.]|nr:ABC transporter substrate-binding protein [Oceanicaulis sp.]
MKWLQALCAVICLALAACSDTGNGADDEQVLRVGVASLPSSLGNPYRGNGRPGSLLWHAIFDGLTRLDFEGDPEPALAVEWELVSP